MSVLFAIAAFLLLCAGVWIAAGWLHDHWIFR